MHIEWFLNVQSKLKTFIFLYLQLWFSLCCSRHSKKKYIFFFYGWGGEFRNKYNNTFCKRKSTTLHYRVKGTTKSTWKFLPDRHNFARILQTCTDTPTHQQKHIFSFRSVPSLLRATLSMAQLSCQRPSCILSA